MPSTQKKKLAVLRCSYTDEDKHLARRGVGRAPDRLGLTVCAPAQRRFRALLAVHLFNDRVFDNDGPGSISSLRRFLSYSMTVSALYDELVFIVPWAMDNAVRSLFEIWPMHCLPGLRIVAERSWSTYHLVHLPTNARLVVARSAHYEPLKLIQARARQDSPSHVAHDVPLHTAEGRMLEAIPPMSPAIETLLAALVTRMNVQDPKRQWGIDMWWGDPLRRQPPEGYDRDGSTALWGKSSHVWELRWAGHPYPQDLVTCLTDPIIGVRGASAQHSVYGWQIHLSGSTLLLRYGAFV